MYTNTMLLSSLEINEKFDWDNETMSKLLLKIKDVSQQVASSRGEILPEEGSQLLRSDNTVIIRIKHWESISVLLYFVWSELRCVVKVGRVVNYLAGHASLTFVVDPCTYSIF